MGQSVGSIHYDLSLNTAKFDQQTQVVRSKVTGLSNSFKSAGSTLTMAGAGLSVFSGAAVLTGKKFVDLASDLQTTQQRMAALSGSTEEAQRILGELYTYVLGKPIAFPDAAKAAQTLMGYGVASKNVVGAMKTLSAFAIVNGADMDQLALAYGQINAKGKLMGQEIIQLTNNFVPVSQIIAKHFNVSIAEAQELMESGAVSAEQFNKAMENFIPQSSIAAQSNTFKNRLISLQGSIRSLGLALLGVKVDKQFGLIVQQGGLFDTLSKMLPKIAATLKKVNEAFSNLSPGMRQFIIAAGLILIALGPVLLLLGTLVFSIGALMSPIGLVIVGIAALAAIIVTLQIKFQILNRIGEVLKQLFDLMKPSLVALWNTISTQLLPSLSRLWQLISPIMVPALKLFAALTGTYIVTSLYILINAIRIAVQVLSIMVSGLANLIQWIRNTINFVVSFAGTVVSVFRGIPGAISGAFNALSGVVRNGIQNALNAVWGFYGRFVDAGWGLITAFANGIRDSFGRAIGAVRDGMTNVRQYLPFSDAKKGPLSDLTLSGQRFAETFAQGIYKGSGAIYSAAAQSLALASPGGQQVNATTNINGSISIGSRSDADYFFNRLTRNQELLGLGLAPAGNNQ